MPIKIVDLFAGPGGLGEGFSRYGNGETFKILVSAEMESTAHQTLRLRSFFRMIRHDERALSRYYEYCNSENVAEAYDSRSRSAWDDAGEEARQFELGKPGDNDELDAILNRQLSTSDNWVLIGGPPCQAYSRVGRSRNIGTPTYRAEDDPRFFLYREYFRIVKDRRPPVFVMENVEGILSATVGGEKIFPKILNDLSSPSGSSDKAGYRIHSLVTDTVYEHGMDLATIDLRDFIVKSERFGIPQARHRVILLGVRTDITAKFDRLKALPDGEYDIRYLAACAEVDELRALIALYESPLSDDVEKIHGQMNLFWGNFKDVLYQTAKGNKVDHRSSSLLNAHAAAEQIGKTSAFVKSRLADRTRELQRTYSEAVQNRA